MMFGLPAGALAIYKNAKPENKKATGSLMLAGALAAFLTGVTEPLEFSFMFAAFPLYVVHALLTAISVFIAASFQWIAGFNFSAGFIDWFLSLKVPAAHMPWMLIVQGLVFAVIYYFVFDFMIKKFNMKTPGRGDDDNDDASSAAFDTATSSTGDKYADLAGKLYAALGGHDNITEIENCITRLRMGVVDSSKVDVDAIRKTGVPGVKVIDKKNVQIIVGTQVQAVLKKAAGLDIETVCSLHGPVLHKEQLADVLKTLTAAAPAPKVKAADNAVLAPVDGAIKPITEVPDETFAAKILGDGFAVVPTSGRVVAPVAGKITTVAQAKHAVGITTPAGVEVLVHIGVDTVQLAGSPFTMMVSEGQQVNAGDALVDVDWNVVKSAGKPTDVIVVFTNPAKIDKLSITAKGAVATGAPIGTIVTK